MEIVTPSYKRAKAVNRFTLKYLEQCKVDWKRVHVFVVAEELDEYKAESIYPVNFHVGERGLVQQRNFIRRHFGAGVPLISFDDDVTALHILTADGKTRPYFDLIKLSEHAFSQLGKIGGTLWGVYAVNNGYFMKKRPTTDLRHIVGGFFGEV